MIKKWWNKLKYWQKGGIISLVFIFLFVLFLGINAIRDSWDKIYQNEQFHCQDFKGFKWTPCSFFDVIEQQILAPLGIVFSFPVLIFALLFEVPIKSDFVLYSLIVLSFLIGTSFYYGVGALIGFIIGKIKKKP